MNELGYFDALLLGILQGVTEFLPISSSAHLALVQRWRALNPNTPALLLFDVLVHMGTLLAVLIVFRRPIARFVASLSSRNHPTLPVDSGAPPSKASAPPENEIRFDMRPAWRILLLAVVATMPTAVIGLAFKDTFESAFGKPRWIAACLLITGAMLAALVYVPRGRRGWRRFAWWQAALVGLAQAAAILPGISRSGATICTASYLGLRRRWAAEFSFLIAAPAIVGGTLLKLRDVLALPADEFTAIPKGPLLLGTVVSLIVGVISLRFLLVAIRRAQLHNFALYCWALGIIILSGST